MKIDPNSTASAQLGAYQKTAEARRDDPITTGGAATPGGISDTVELSDRAKEVQAAREAIDALPDVRGEKIARLKTQIQNGTYSVNARQVASGMIRESLLSVFA